MPQKNAGLRSSPDSSPVACFRPPVCWKRHDAEAVEAGVAQRLPVLGDVHAEAARAARAGGEEDVLLDDVLGRHAVLVAQRDEVLHEVADGEVRRVALPAVAELFADLEPLVRGALEHLHVVADAPDAGLDEVVVRHREAADEHRDLRLLRLGEGEVRHVLDPVLGLLVEAEALALLVLELLELGVDVLDEREALLRVEAQPVDDRSAGSALNYRVSPSTLVRVSGSLKPRGERARPRSSCRA